MLLNNKNSIGDGWGPRGMSQGRGVFLTGKRKDSGVLAFFLDFAAFWENSCYTPL